MADIFSLNNKTSVRTNVITGFLGAGKTSAIRHLLQTKPAGERWAVLINEFGKVGIDSSLLGQQQTGDANIHIKEVAGGCMCCAAGLPMKVALNQLIGKTRPDRLLIEPSGLGHPEEVIAVLSSQQYQSLIDLRATVTLVDARHISHQRYRDHETFRQQLHIADVIVANKADSYAQDSLSQLNRYLGDLNLECLPLHVSHHAQLDESWLTPAAKFSQAVWQQEPAILNVTNEEKVLPDCGFWRAEQRLADWYSCGWRFKAGFSFDYQPLLQWCRNLTAVRIKAVMRTSRGDIAINQADSVLNTDSVLQSLTESRIELISDKKLNAGDLEKQLLQLIHDEQQ